jgi:voltage-gated potassium channel
MEKKRDEYEQTILKRVSFVLWAIIALTGIIAMLLRASGLDFRNSVASATSVITQIYIGDQPYGALIFILSFISKILIIYIVYVLILLFNEGVFKKSIEEGRIMKNIHNLKDHYIICGGGRVGGRVAEDLAKAKKPFVIIDRDIEKVESFNKRKMLAMGESALEDSSLQEAGIAKAKVLISCIDNDGDNILQIIVAKKLNPKIKIISRASHEKLIPMMKNVGADEVIIPEVIGGQKIADSALKF